MFEPVSNKVSLPDMEERVLQRWKRDDVFRRSVEARAGGPVYTMYEGPPTANGVPGIHHVLARVFKDVMPRFKTMRGHYAPRKGGWDTHGLPVELEVERELDLVTKRDIEEFGIAEFNERCKESVFRYVKEWENLTDRIAFWVDMDDPYVTLTNDYIESGWWIFKQLWDKGLVFRDYKVTPHCPRCVTSLSSHEVALGYREDTPDPSVHIKLRVRETEQARNALPALDVPTYFLAWTTTPWTLPANVALAVAEGARYVVIEGPLGPEGRRERLIVAEALVDATVQEPYEVLARPSGRDLAGIGYQPLFDWVEPDRPAHRVVLGDFVSLTDGTGIVHVAPAYGAEDLELGRAEGLPIVHTVQLDGAIADFPGVEQSGRNFKDADPSITDDLQRRGLLYRSGTIEHTYPFCWRCDSPLLYYAKESWYLRTTAVKESLIRANREIGWRPAHLQEGRFGEWLQNNVDWALSRERYWGTPIPVWMCASCDHSQAIGGVGELAAQTELDGFTDGMDLHRPFLDAVAFRCSACGGRMARVPEVMDAWYDSGAMPIAQWHYPFENADRFQQHYPADFICEAVDQTRGWFYTLHALAVLLFDGPAYKNVISLGHILDGNGEKMSKSRGNVVDPWKVIESRGADPLRWYMYTATAAGNPRRFSEQLVGDTVRRFLLPLWNTYSFFVTYANLDHFDPAGSAAPPVGERPVLDRWLISGLQRLVTNVTEQLEDYEIGEAAKLIEGFVGELSSWWVRRSRRRFWRTEDDADKQSAYHTLYETLSTLCHVLAPLTPFVADEMYRNLVSNRLAGSPDSVHLADWPEPAPALIDPAADEGVRLAMKLSSIGRAARGKAGIKVRQPLASAQAVLPSRSEREALPLIEEQLRDELNVKEVVAAEDESALVRRVVKPNLARLGPKLGRDLDRVVKLIGALDDAEVARVAERAQAGLQTVLDGVELAADDLIVEAEDRQGFVSVSDGPIVVAVEVTMTPELRLEGHAREIVRHLQELRRTADLDISDRITAFVAPVEEDGRRDLDSVLAAHGGYIGQETLADRVTTDAPPDGVTSNRISLDSLAIQLGVVKAG